MSDRIDKPVISENIDISIVVTLYNEEGSIRQLYESLVTVLERVGKSFEIVLIDDGSTDKTFELASLIWQTDPRLKVIKLKKNYGQTPGLAAGIDYASGEIIITMDGDLQHDPTDIPAFLQKIEEGYDVVSGWREKRVDSFILRRFPSLVANRLMALLSGLKLHDFGTTFKAYRKEIIKKVDLYGELHRFIPALTSAMGASVTEIPIKNIVRTTGKSNYGLSRTFRVFFDLILVKFLISFASRPLHFFGIYGGLSLGAGFAVGFFLLLKKLLTGSAIFVEHGPLLLLSSLLIISGIQVITVGLVAEIVTRIYHKTQDIKIYYIEKVLRGKKQG